MRRTASDLGGAEFRLPLLIAVFTLYPHRAVRINLLISLVTLAMSAAAGTSPTTLSGHRPSRLSGVQPKRRDTSHGAPRLPNLTLNCLPFDAAAAAQQLPEGWA